MKIHLYSKNGSLGEIILNSGSIHTKEFKGILLANEKYFEHRVAIKKYFSDLKYRPTKGLLWKILNRIDSKGKKVLEEIKELDLKIKSDEFILTSEKSEILIQDTLKRTSKGNWFIQIDVLQMDMPKEFPNFELFQVEWLYPAPPDGILGIKKGKELIMEY